MWRLVAAVKIDAGDIGAPEVPVNSNTLGAVLSLVFIIVGSLAILFLLIGAVRYVTSNGEQQRITQAKNTILYAVIGIIVSLSAFTIVQFTLGRLTGTL